MHLLHWVFFFFVIYGRNLLQTVEHIAHYSTTLNFGVLPLVEIDHGRLLACFWQFLLKI